MDRKTGCAGRYWPAATRSKATLARVFAIPDDLPTNGRISRGNGAAGLPADCRKASRGAAHGGNPGSRLPRAGSRMFESWGMLAWHAL